MSPISSRNSVPPSACSKRPRRDRLRAGERAALVAEQLGFEQVLRDRRGVDRDERPRRARAVPVQRARDQLLAGARFAGDQHRRVATATAGRWRGTPPASPAPGRASRATSRGRLARGLAAQAFARRARRISVDRLVDVERLGQIFERAALERRDRAVEIRVRGHDDDRQLGMALLDVAAAARCPIRPACGCRRPAPAARSSRSACSTSRAEANDFVRRCPRAPAPSRAPSGSSDRRRRSRRVSSLSWRWFMVVACIDGPVTRLQRVELQRQQDREHGAAGHAFAFDRPAVLLRRRSARA